MISITRFSILNDIIVENHNQCKYCKIMNTNNDINDNKENTKNSSYSNSNNNEDSLTETISILADMTRESVERSQLYFDITN